MFHLEDAKRRTVNKRLPQVQFEIGKQFFLTHIFSKSYKKITNDLRFQTSEGPSFTVTEENGFLTFGIEDPSGLSTQSRGLLGQFLGFLHFQVVSDSESGTLVWSNQKKLFRHEEAQVTRNLSDKSDCWSFLDNKDWLICKRIKIHVNKIYFPSNKIIFDQIIM